LSDSDLEDDEDKKVTLPKQKSKARSSDPFDVPDEDKRIACEEHEEHVAKGKVVKIPDMAFVTWVQVWDIPSISLTPLQVPSFSDVSLHRYDRIRTIWVRRESQIA
jgi:hypothetical protein